MIKGRFYMLTPLGPFVRQPLTIRITNCDDRLQLMRNNAEKRKHGATDYYMRDHLRSFELR